MNQNMKTKPIVEGALLSAIAVILGLAFVYLPLLGMFASFVWPVPIIILGIRHGIRISIIGTIVSGLIVGMFAGPLYSLTVIFGFGMIGVALGFCFKKDFAPTKTLGIGAVSSVISKIILIGVSFIILDINPIQFQMDLLLESLDRALELYSSMGIDSDSLTDTVEDFRQMAKVIPLIIPGLLISVSVFDTFLNFTVARLILNKLGHKIENFPSLKYWSFPAYTVAAFLLGIIFLIMYGFYPITFFRVAGMNLQIVFSFVFILQGLALLSFYIAKIKMPKIIKVIIILLLLFNPFFGQLFMWGGMIDILFDFRKLSKRSFSK